MAIMDWDSMGRISMAFDENGGSMRIAHTFDT